MDASMTTIPSKQVKEENAGIPTISREERVRLLRLTFCHKAMIDSNGFINQDYFWRRPVEEEWSDLERLLLVEEFLPHKVLFFSIPSLPQNEIFSKKKKSLIEIRTELVKMFATTDLMQYGDRKFDELTIEREYENNIKKAIAENECVNSLHFAKKKELEQELEIRKKEAKNDPQFEKPKATKKKENTKNKKKEIEKNLNSDEE
ncbi:hypothetical protein RFI_31779 [Reticulomyxa filosa]|uniref:Uncharacterized protein n=1 Tax=Reticulomyxa filosa TaxID=46433 RepID=X6LVF9_RETFI|nr:hypothetical protein RFI_31779 [Reticulomyxa filosa]|eukprot:ETO05614.1 hypothetical protein RFI_31779 [Reticulomyxa filosa]